MDKTLTRIQAPEFFNEVCEHIISGGALPNLCQLQQLKYSRVIEYIYADPDRSERYEKALQARGEWFIQSILNELKDIGLADIRLAYAPDNTLLPVTEWPDALARTVQAVEVIEEWEGQGASRTKVGETKRLKMWDKLRALELLGKNLKLFKEQVEHTGQLTLEDLVSQSMEEEPKPISIPEPTVNPVQTNKPNFGNIKSLETRV